MPRRISDYPTARWLEFFVCSYGAYVSVVSLIVFFIVLQKRLLLLSPAPQNLSQI
jgi:heme/copper-type cytochrome/quinol oxidase subunit 1